MSLIGLVLLSFCEKKKNPPLLVVKTLFLVYMWLAGLCLGNLRKMAEFGFSSFENILLGNSKITRLGHLTLERPRDIYIKETFKQRVTSY